MKRIIVLLCLLPMVLMAQISKQAIFEKYSGKQGFSVVSIAGSMLASLRNNADEKLEEALEGIDQIEILSYNDKNSKKNAGYEHYLEFLKEIEKLEVENILTKQSEETSNISIFIVKGEKGKVKELLFVEGTEVNFTAILITGNFVLKNISNLYNSIQEVSKTGNTQNPKSN